MTMENEIKKSEWDELSGAEQRQYAYSVSRHLDSALDMIRLIPECPDHGDICIPHAKEWARNAKAILCHLDQYLLMQQVIVHGTRDIEKELYWVVVNNEGKRRFGNHGFEYLPDAYAFALGVANADNPCE